jgi:diphosphomevalonate decarboxylase
MNYREEACAFAPVNIAIVKYWGKRNKILNLPVTDSLSLSLKVGTTTSLREGKEKDEIELNGKIVAPESSFYQRTVRFLDLVRPHPHFFFTLKTKNDIPTAAGIASSASGFAALTLAVNKFFQLDLTKKELSCLARRGSGSACRSIYPGFVRWQAGKLKDGSDSYAKPISDTWSDLRMGAILLSEEEKPVSSREAMARSVATSPLYPFWPTLVLQDMKKIVKSIRTKDFALFGQTAEHNALAMHATMHTAFPPVFYWLEKTVEVIQRVLHARQDGLQLFLTMHAGPNVKLLFLKKDESEVKKLFPQLLPLEIAWS